MGMSEGQQEKNSKSIIFKTIALIQMAIGILASFLGLIVLVKRS